MTNSEYVTLDNCKVVGSNPRGFLIECPDFPDETAFGNNRLWVHLGFFGPSQGTLKVEFEGSITVHRKFLLHYNVMDAITRKWTSGEDKK